MATESTPAVASRPIPRDPRSQTARSLILVGLLGLVTAPLAAARGVAPLDQWLYPVVWWCWIFLADGAVFFRRGESLLLTYPKRFVFYALVSLLYWCAFELVNLRLGNWSYVNVVTSGAARWLGYGISFATVIPGLFETSDLLDSTGIWKDHVRLVRGLRVSPQLLAGIGLSFIALPLLLPGWFFMLIWAAPFFLAEAWLMSQGESCLVQEALLGRWRRWVLVGLSGALCGLLWEGWNSVSATRWVYHLPWANAHKIFEMPALGYLGFPVLALSTFSVMNVAVRAWDRRPFWLRVLVVLAGAGFSVLAFSQIDRWTIATFR